ncbi:MAG: sugar transferase [Clostridia bacterium]|nr:sugar transferase [Clostridia bacterium]
MLRQWDRLPTYMKTPEVRPYWEELYNKRIYFVLKRFFDVILALFLLVIFLIPMIVISILIKLDSPGTIFYRQERVTTYGEHFRIHKFRTMVMNAETMGTSVTIEDDNRVTSIGEKLRRFRLDEIPQIFDVLEGSMSFVGTRPEAVKYVEKYKPEYNATLLLPAGITSEASIRFKDEDKLLSSECDADEVYMEKILPRKMEINLYSLHKASLKNDLCTMIRTIFAVLGKEYK